MAEAAKTKKGKAKERINRSYTEAFKAKVVKEYLTSSLSLNALADKHEIYPQMIVRWKTDLKSEPGIKGLKKPKVVRKPRKKGQKKA